MRFFDLGTGGLAQLFGLQLGEALELPIRNASVVIKAMRFMLIPIPNPNTSPIPTPHQAMRFIPNLSLTYP